MVRIGHFFSPKKKRLHFFGGFPPQTGGIFGNCLGGVQAVSSKIFLKEFSTRGEVFEFETAVVCSQKNQAIFSGCGG